MDLPATARPKAPYGLSFPVQDLIFVRNWASRRSLTMNVLLDQVLDRAEFEEMVMIRAPAGQRGRRTLTIWRTQTCILAQPAGGRPKSFPAVAPALTHFAGLFVAPNRRGPSLLGRLRAMIGA